MKSGGGLYYDGKGNAVVHMGRNETAEQLWSEG